MSIALFMLMMMFVGVAAQVIETEPEGGEEELSQYVRFLRNVCLNWL